MAGGFPRVTFDEGTAQHRDVTPDVRDRIGLGEHVGPFEMAPPCGSIVLGEGAAGTIAFGPVGRTPTGGVGVHEQQLSDDSDRIAEGGAQHTSPRSAVRPSRTASPAMTSPAIGSAQLQPNVELSTRPTSRTAER